MKILVMENKKKVAYFIKKGLKEEGFQVDIAHDEKRGLNQAANTTYDLIILDMSLSKKNGLTMIEELRTKDTVTPILCMIAKDTVDNIVACFNAGADGCLSKPFAIAELLSRSRALIRRCFQTEGSKLCFSNLRLDRISHKLWEGKQEITLTPQEYKLLEYFMLNPAKILTRDMISENAWDYDFNLFSNTIDVYISYLRKKIDLKSDNKLIHTLRGVGYIFKEKPS